MSSEAIWYVSRGSDQAGPITPLELALMAGLSHLRASDLIWCSGMPDWVPAGSVAGLLPPAVLPAPTSAPAHAPQQAVARLAPGPDMASSRQPSMLELYYAQTARNGTRERSVTAQPGPRLPQPPAAPQSLQVSSLMPSGGTTDATAAHAEVQGSRLSGQIAEAVIVAMERYHIYTLDDLANDDRLRLVAAYAFDALPGTVRLVLSRTVGRAVAEGFVLEFLTYVRNRVPLEQRGADLREIVRGVARSTWLQERVNATFEKSRAGLSELVSNTRSTADRLWSGVTSSAQTGFGLLSAVTGSGAAEPPGGVPALPAPRMVSHAGTAHAIG